MSKLKALKHKALQNPEVQREYEALSDEFNYIGELLRMRKAAGLTQEQVAEKMHTQKSNISRMEKSPANIKIETLSRYAAACGFKISIAFTELPPNNDDQLQCG